MTPKGGKWAMPGTYARARPVGTARRANAMPGPVHAGLF